MEPLIDSFEKMPHSKLIHISRCHYLPFALRLDRNVRNTVRQDSLMQTLKNGCAQSTCYPTGRRSLNEVAVREKTFAASCCIDCQVSQPMQLFHAIVSS